MWEQSEQYLCIVHGNEYKKYIVNTTLICYILDGKTRVFVTLGTALFATDLLEWARKNMEGSAKGESEKVLFGEEIIHRLGPNIPASSTINMLKLNGILNNLQVLSPSFPFTLFLY